MSSSFYKWAVLKHGQHMETSSGEILHPSLASYRVGREIQERKGRGNDKGSGGMRKALSMILHHCWFWEAL
jgi:hypothetical protein